MAHITYNSIKKFRYYGKDMIETRQTEQNSLRDNLIKKILLNQLNKQVEFDEYMKFKNKFIYSSKQIFSNSNKGLISNELYKKRFEEINVKETLSCCGLNCNEIDILLQDSKLGNSTEEAYIQKLIDIEQRLEQREAILQSTSKEHFASALKLNRHEYEEECRKSCSETSKKLSCLLKLEPYKDTSLPLEHPINNLSDLEKFLFSDFKNESIFKRKREENLKNEIKNYVKKPRTLWDMKERPILTPEFDYKSEIVCSNPVVASFASTSNTTPTIITTSNNKQKKSEKCFLVKSNNSSISIDFSRPFVCSLKQSELIPFSEIKNNRLLVDEIKSNCKFINYTPGTPSPILYIKNLPHNVNPLKIVSLFGNFEIENESKIEYRILKGKMKGQAFVTFQKIEVSQKALSICNGYLIENKPIIIEYARKKL
ncbi:UNVERIFIED_CONTAM: hypothetical protein RMT77_007011 [Armadillidium vulgare]